MLSVLLDVRRARQRRWTLVALTACALVLPFVARFLPSAALARTTSVFASGSLTALSVILSGASVLSALGTVLSSRREAHWTSADDIAWLISLPSMSLLAALSTAPLPVSEALFSLTAIALAVRVPPGRLVAAAAASCLVAPVVRVALRFPAESVWELAIFAALTLVTHVTLARATHALAFVLAEREALLSEKRAHTRGKSQNAAAPVSSQARARAPSDPTELTAVEPGGEDIGWEALVERLRSSLSSLCDAAGVEASVRADLQGLAPPSSRMRANVLKIAHETAHYALRDSAPTSIEITLRRGDGGLLLEVQDNGAVGENVRLRKTLASVRGRVVPLGGSAELKRGDLGWVVLVKLPCEQLN